MLWSLEIYSVAIITPAKQFDIMLERAILSVQNNSSDDLNITHIIIFDNHYPKNVKLRCRDNYEMVIAYNTGIRGPAATRNIGLSYVNELYDYFGFLDADDYLTDDYILKSVNVISSDYCRVAFGQGISVDLNEQIISFSNVPIKNGSVADRLIFANIIGCPSGLMLMNSLDNRTVRFDEDLRLLEDYFYYLRLFNIGNSFYKTDARYFYQIHEGQTTHSAWSESLQEQFIILATKIKLIDSRGIFQLLVKLRVNMSFYRLSHKSKVSGILSGLFLGILCPEWTLGRVKMVLKNWLK
ncbi:glycosyltransferase [Planktomarina temperata]|nr:glycosyltransferase [Planktomarina temperata]